MNQQYITEHKPIDPVGHDNKLVQACIWNILASLYLGPCASLQQPIKRASVSLMEGSKYKLAIFACGKLAASLRKRLAILVWEMDEPNAVSVTKVTLCYM